MRLRWLRISALSMTLGVLGAGLLLRKGGGDVASSNVGQRDVTAAGSQMGPAGHVYAPARWRLVTLEELSKTSLQVSQIAIRHKLSAEFPFRPGAWEPDGPPPERSVDSAMQLAESIADQAAKAPESFADLARQFSDDAVSRSRGGSLGVMRADQLVPLDLLDALATLEPGQVSKAFRSPFGFHIVKRDELPPAAQVSGQRLVIGYEGTFAQARPVTRSRAEARSIIEGIAEKARARPSSFAQLVREFSETYDREQDGDIGELSTRDPEYLPAEVEVLAQLPMGTVSEILETRFGFVVLKRTPLVPRKVYAMAAIELAVEWSPEAGRFAPEAQAELSRTMLRQISDNEALFAQFQAEHCCKGVQRWVAGRRAKALERALDALELGQLRQQPLEQPEHISIIRRLDPARLPAEPERRAELPSPVEPDFESFLPFNDGANLAEGCRVLIAALGKDRSFASATQVRAGRILLELANFMTLHSKDTPAIQRKIFESLDMLKQELGDADYGRFVAFAKKWAMDQLLPQQQGEGGQ